MISGINKLSMTVTDHDAAIEFWRDRVGFAVTTDASDGAYRWVEVTSPNGAVVIALTTRAANAPDPGAGIPDGQPTLPAVLATDDLAATHRQLADAGVEFLAEPSEQFWGWWSMFTDGQGNRIALVPAGQ